MSDLAMKLWQLSQDSFTYGSPWKVAQFEIALQDEHNKWLTIEKQQELVAFLQYQHILDEIEIYNVVVAKEHQQVGLGHQLLENLFAICHAQGVKKLFLEVRLSNTQAQRFYEKMGFEKVGQRKNYYHYPTEDALLLMKEVK